MPVVCHRRLIHIALMLAVLASACGPAAAPPGPTYGQASLAGVIKVAGSTTVQPLAEKLAATFGARNPRLKIDISDGGTAVGVKSAGQGTVDLGMASRDITADEMKLYPKMRAFVIGKDAIAAVVNPGVAVKGVTREQLRDIFSGAIRNWKDVGGADRPIILVSREEGSGTRAAFQELVMGSKVLISDAALLFSSNGAIRTTVSSAPDSIGYLSLGQVDASVKVLPINGVDATEANAASGAYPVVRPLLMLSNGDPAGATKAWLDWILGAEGQAVVKGEGYVPLAP